MGNNQKDKHVPDKTDRLLWAEVRSGNERAYDILYEKYGQDLFSYGMHFSEDRELVKDCIQEVFVRIYKNRTNLGETGNIKFYLLYALKNELYQTFRKKAHDFTYFHDNLHFEADQSTERETEEEEKRQDALEKIMKMINALPLRQKEIIYYRYIEELSFKEICLLMNLNYQSAQNLLQRSIKKLRSTFSDQSLYVLLCLLSANSNRSLFLVA